MSSRQNANVGISQGEILNQNHYFVASVALHKMHSLGKENSAQITTTKCCIKTFHAYL